MDNRGPQYAKISLELPEPIISAFRVACFAHGTAGALNVATRYLLQPTWQKESSCCKAGCTLFLVSMQNFTELQ